MRLTLLAASLGAIAFAVAVVVAVAVPTPARAAESYATCTGFVDSVPATISTPGTWCLRRNVTTAMASGDAILIDGPDITLDCNGYRVTGTAGADTAARGIVAEFEENPTVRRCHVRGFDHGTFLTGSAPVVEDSRFEDHRIGIYVNQQYGADNFNRSGAAVVRGNVVMDSGSIGIQTYGRASVLDNIVDGVGAVAGTEHWGIHLLYGSHGIVAGNMVRNVAAAEFGTIGIGAYDSYGDVVFRDNLVIAMPGVDSHVGILCGAPQNATSRNRLSGWITPVSGCTTHADIIVP